MEPGTTIHVELGTAAAPILVRWNTRAYWTEPFAKWGHDDAYAIITDDGVVLIDPREPAAEKLTELESGWSGRPVASLLTNAWHEQDCYGFRERYRSPVWSAAAGESEHDGEPDHFFVEGDELPGGIEAVVLSDGFCGDTVFFWTAPDGERVAFVGDAVSAQIRDGEIDFHLQMYGRPTLDDYRAAFQRVADREIDMMCLAHGGCMADDPGKRLRHTLQNDQLYRNEWPATVMPPPGRKPPDRSLE
jgi:hypothetical protein